MLSNFFTFVETTELSENILKWISRRVLLKEMVAESDFNLIVYADYYGLVFAQKIAH